MRATVRSRVLVSRITLSLAVCVPLGVLFVGVGPASAAAGTAGSRSADNKYIGADKCKSCHSAAESGDQYGKWHEAKHAKAFETLAGEEAKKLAAEKGIADPQKSDECVRCHVTAFGVPEDQIKKGFKIEQGVQCEVCHGPGEAHMKARFAAAAKGESTGGYTQVPEGEIISVPKEDTCLACHNDKSPSYKPFCYHEFSAKIRHLNPKKPRSELDLGKCSCPKCKDGCPESCKALAQGK